MNKNNIISQLEAERVDITLSELYGDHIDERRARLVKLVNTFSDLYGDREISLFSVPGRSELSGNHTDHNHGKVIAASIDLDIVAAASARDDGIIRLHSEGFPEDVVDINAYVTPDPSDFGRSSALIAGMCAGFRKKGYKVGGFDAYTTSNVLKGSGLSSSAAFEVMVGNILNYLYNDGKVDNVEIAKIAQYSENEFFGKPCGLMDQTACAVGGIIAIDFADPSLPIIEKIDFDLTAAGYRLCIVDTGGSHADLTDEYAAVPAEMKSVAAHFGKTCLRDTDEKAFIEAIPVLREKFGDRAVLRGLHFFAENRRVAEQTDALKKGDVRRFLDYVIRSGQSSFCYLQNAYSCKDVKGQGVSLAVCISERLLAGSGAWRLHGGGFAGTTQAFVPADKCDTYRKELEAVYGDGSCYILRIRRDGAIKII